MVPGLAAPYWLKVKRFGHEFSAYASRSGTKWRLLRRLELPMAQGIYAGIAVTGLRTWPPALASRYPRLPTRATFDNLCEAPFLVSPFIPRIELQNGSMLEDRIDWADAVSIHFPGGLLGPEPLAVQSVSTILFQWVPSRLQYLLHDGHPGVILATGEFVAGDFRGLDRNRVQISSVLQGLRSYDIGHDVLAVVLRKTNSTAPAFQVQTVDGRILYSQDLAFGDGDVLIRHSLQSVRKVPIYELRAIRRMTG